MTAYPPVGSRFGRYQITGVLGQGGMGVVFSAVHESLGRRVALKVLSPELADREDFRHRFEREASALARLYSPHIIDVYDFGEVDDWLFIATQLVAGRDLREWVAQVGPLPPREALGLIAQVAAALSDAHDAGVIHRDIKPSNILVHQSTDELFAYVCDFGISQIEDAERTRTTGLVGTYGYMAPERHEGAEASVASDVYSLGCVLYAALTGQPPYVGTDVQVAMQHLHSDIPAYDGPEPASTAINRILRRCLAKDPADRYPSASALRSDLLAALKAIPDDAEPLRTPHHAPRNPPRTRRQRTVALAGAVSVLVIVGAGVLLGTGTLSQDPPSPVGSTSGASQQTGSRGHVNCWNGEDVARVSECSQPVGRQGLRWAFPSLERDFEGCYRVFDATRTAKPDASLRTWFCPSPGTRDVGIGYTEWSSVEGAKRHFTNVFGEDPSDFVVGGVVEGYKWALSQPNSVGFYKTARLYKDIPFSATVWTRNLGSVERVCLEMTARSMQTFKAQPVNCKPEAN